MLLNLFICSTYGLLLFSTGFQVDKVEGKAISALSNEDTEETTPTILKSNDWNNEEDDYGLGIIFDTSELDFYGRKQSPSVEPETEQPDIKDDASTDDIEKLVVTSKPYLTCGEGDSDSSCE